MSTNITLFINAEDRATQVLTKIQNDVKKTQDSISKGNQQIIESTKQLNVDVLKTASSFAALGSGAIALYTSFSTLDKASLRVTIAQKELTSAQAAAISTQRAYEESVRKFGENSEQTMQAYLRMQAAQERVEITTQRVKMAQDDLSNTYLNFFVNLVPQTISIIMGMQNAFKALGITSITQLAPSIRAVGLALTSTFITNPIGISIIGISTAVALLTTNTFGLRDRIIELGNVILAFIDRHLKPLADAIRFVLDAMRPLTDFFGSVFALNIEKSSDAIDDLKGLSIQSFNDIENTMIDFNAKATNIFSNVDATVKEFGNVINNTAREMEKSIHSTSINTNENLNVSIKAFEKMGDSILDTSLKMDTLSNVTNNTMKKISNSVKEHTSIIVENNTRIISSIEEATIAVLKGASTFSLGKVRHSGTVELSDGYITPGGTIVKGMINDNTMVLKREVVEGIRSGKITRVTADDYIKAQHGFEGLVTKPTLFLVGEAGAEHVKINPSNNNTLKLIVEFVTSDGIKLGSETLDLANKEAILRLKAKGVRLF